jgi:hypothetical protein
MIFPYPRLFPSEFYGKFGLYAVDESILQQLLQKLPHCKTKCWRILLQYGQAAVKNLF